MRIQPKQVPAKNLPPILYFILLGNSVAELTRIKLFDGEEFEMCQICSNIIGNWWHLRGVQREEKAPGAGSEPTV